MHAEGNDTFAGAPRNLNGNHFNSKGAVFLVVLLGFSIAASEATDSGGIALPSMLRQEYIDFEECFAERIASNGLSAICTAKDGVSWRVEQTQAELIVPKLDVAANPQDAAALLETRNESINSVQFKDPLILAPVDQEECSLACTVAAQDEDGTWSYYNLISKSGIFAVNQPLYQKHINLESARLEDKR